jgi:AcrR family transcriptional regulator
MTAATGDPVIASDGRVIGRRALATRRRLLDATEALVSRTGMHDLKVVDITRSVGTAPATFYQYFPDVEAALMELFDEVSTALLDTVVPLLTPAWSTADDLARARRYVETYWSLWESRYAVLRAAIVRGDEGDPRWIEVRQRGYVPMLTALTETVSAAQRAGRVPVSLEPFSVASCGLAMLIPLMSYTTGPVREPGLQPLDRDSIARVLFASLTGFPA